MELSVTWSPQTEKYGCKSKITQNDLYVIGDNEICLSDKVQKKKKQIKFNVGVNIHK